MRKSLLVGLFVFVVVAVSAAIVTWFIQAREIKNNLEQMLASVGDGHLRITYDALETSGFPTEVAVSIVNPKISGRIDPLFNSHPEMQKHPMPEWNEEITIDGTVKISVNAMSDRYTLSSQGSWKTRGTIGDKTMSMASTPGSTHCTLEMRRAGGWFGKMWDFDTLKEHGKDLLNDFRMFDCAVSDVTVTDQATQAVLTRNGPYRFYLTHDINGDKRNIRVYAKFENAEVTQDGDKMYAAYMYALAPQYGTPIMMSPYGKQNVEIDFSYAGPLTPGSNPKTEPLDVHVSKFTIANDAYQSAMTLDIVNADTPAGHEAKFVLHSESTFTEIYDVLVQDMLRSFVQRAYAEQNLSSPLTPMLQQHTPESLYALLSPALPNFRSLGKLTTAIDLNYKGNAEFTAGDVTLANLQLGAAAYGIGGKGTATLSPQTPVPVANMTLACNNCLRLVDDIVSYAGRLQTMTQALQPGSAATLPLEAEKVAGFKNFLQALAVADADNPQNFTYSFVSDGKSGMTLNGKRLDEVMMLYSQYMPMKPRAN